MSRYYDGIAESYYNLYGMEQKHKLKFLKNLIRRYNELKLSTSILDLGCGSGLSSDFRSYIVGVDSSSKLINLARKRFQKHINKQFLVHDANEKLPFKRKNFDITISLSAFHHFKSFNSVLKELERVTKDYIFISFPHKFKRFHGFDNDLKKAVSVNKKLKLVDVYRDDVDMFYVIKVLS